VQAWPEVLQSVTAEDVRAAAEQVLRPEGSVTMHVTAPAGASAADAPSAAPAAPAGAEMTTEEVTQ